MLSGETVSFDFQNPKGNRWYHYIGTPQKDSNGKVTAMQFIAIDIHERKTQEDTLTKAKDHLQQENLLLKSTTIHRYGFDNIIGQSLQMQEIYSLILEIASSDASVLIYGESGTGKELVANAIHSLGERKEKSFLPVNCGGIPENLVESEFFGYKKGAFTGANIDKSGFLEIADGGTLFLDEIGEINENMQVKLLRAIDGNGYAPLGGNLPVIPDIVAYDLIPKLKREWSDLLIITMTGHSSKELEEKIRNQGILYYMEKPVDFSELESIVQHMSKKIIKIDGTDSIKST